MGLLYNWLTQAVTGTGDVVGPSSVTDTALAIFDGTSGKLLKEGVLRLSGTGAFSVANGNVLRLTGDPSAIRYLQIHAGSAASGKVRIIAQTAGDTDLQLDAANAGRVVIGTTAGDGGLTINDSSVAAPLAITARSAPPSSPDTDHIYLDDGTNTTSGNPGFRKWNGSSWVDLGGGGGGVTDHGALTGLGDDDHTQYLLADGSRQLSDDWYWGTDTILGKNATFGVNASGDPTTTLTYVSSINRLTSATDGPVALAYYRLATSSTAAAGLGYYIGHFIDDDSGSLASAAFIYITWLDASEGNTDASYAIKVASGGSVETALELKGSDQTGELFGDIILTDASSIAYTQLADGTDGELITWDADGHIDTVAVGNAGQLLKSNGTGAAPAFADDVATLTFLIPTGVLAAGAVEGALHIDFDCTITQVTLLAGDSAGDLTIDIWKDSYANYPATDDDSICGGNEPSISSGIKMQDSTLTDWTTSLSAGDHVKFYVDDLDTLTWVLIAIKVKKG